MGKQVRFQCEGSAKVYLDSMETNDEETWYCAEDYFTFRSDTRWVIQESVEDSACATLLQQATMVYYDERYQPINDENVNLSCRNQKSLKKLLKWSRNYGASLRGLEKWVCVPYGSRSEHERLRHREAVLSAQYEIRKRNSLQGTISKHPLSDCATQDLEDGMVASTLAEVSQKYSAMARVAATDLGKVDEAIAALTVRNTILVKKSSTWSTDSNAKVTRILLNDTRHTLPHNSAPVDNERHTAPPAKHDRLEPSSTFCDTENLRRRRRLSLLNRNLNKRRDLLSQAATTFSSPCESFSIKTTMSSTHSNSRTKQQDIAKENQHNHLTRFSLGEAIIDDQRQQLNRTRVIMRRQSTD